MNRPGAPEPIHAARASFPALERWTYLDVAGRGIISREARAALDAHLDERMLDGGDKQRFFALVEATRARFATLIRAAPEEVAFTKNISEGLNIVATAVDWRPGDNVVVCPELEHPNNVYVWRNLARAGVETRCVAARDGRIPADAMIAAIDGRTRIVTASTVTFAPGFRTEVARIGRACRSRDVLFLVDAAQSVGVIDTDVGEELIDALAVSTQKGLLGLYGMGFLYVRRAWAERLKPAYLARFGVDLGEAHEAALGAGALKLAPAARRFDLGNYNFAACAAVNASMEQLAAWGTAAIERHATALGHALARGFLELGLPVCGGPPGPHLAHLVTVGSMSEDHYGTGDARLNRLHQHLAENRVKLSIRRGTLRFSLHVYNDADDVSRVLELTRQFLRTSGT